MTLSCFKKDGQINILGLENMIHKDFIDTFVLSTNVKEHLAIPQAYWRFQIIQGQKTKFNGRVLSKHLNQKQYLKIRRHLKKRTTLTKNGSHAKTK